MDKLQKLVHAGLTALKNSRPLQAASLLAEASEMFDPEKPFLTEASVNWEFDANDAALSGYPSLALQVGDRTYYAAYVADAEPYVEVGYIGYVQGKSQENDSEVFQLSSEKLTPQEVSRMEAWFKSNGCSTVPTLSDWGRLLSLPATASSKKSVVSDPAKLIKRFTADADAGEPSVETPSVEFTNVDERPLKIKRTEDAALRRLARAMANVQCLPRKKKD